MAFFTERMEALANELRTSRQERSAFVFDVQQTSRKILADAQVFIKVLGQEHGAMADRLSEDLASHEKERLCEANARREQNREQHQSMRTELLEALAQTRVQRQQHVAELLTEFRAAQAEVANDLRAAAGVWQRFVHAGSTANGGHRGKENGTAERATRGRHPVKAEEAVETPERGSGHAAETNESSDAASHASHHEKAKETRHAHRGSHGSHHGKSKETRHSR